MADFAITRAALAEARSAMATAQAAAAHAAAHRRTLAQAKGRGARRLDANDQAGSEDRARLEEHAKQADARLEAARAEAVRARQAAAAAMEEFASFTDPRRNVARLSDRSPFALLPVRVETRFMIVGEGESRQHQLWVRIYPDDCSIDTFEPTLSKSELANAQRYWRGMWRAGGVEADQRAAWRSLVAAHGSGRARWIVDTYQPINLQDQPAKVASNDQVLVIPTQTELVAFEAARVAAYWEAIWLADDDDGKQSIALAALEGAVGQARAAQLVSGYKPYNLTDRPQPPTTKGDLALETAFVVFPPDPPTVQSSWSQAPSVKQFPERFVVIGYSERQPPLQAIGGVVSLPLYVGPDPSADPAEGIHPEDGDLFVPDELQWMVDFDRAVDAGVGIAIDLTPEQAQRGFDRLLVVGLQLSTSDTGGAAALEELFQHHASGRSGLSLVRQGTTAHNTTGTGTGYTRSDDPDQSFDDRKNEPLFTPRTDPMQKRDGQWVAELLGIDPALFASIHGSDGRDQMQARAMQRALWPATLGYWMETMLAGVFSDEAIQATRWFFTQFVSGQGAAPAIRIGGQPYGILPTTAFSRIRWLEHGPRELGVRSDVPMAFLSRLFGILRTIDADWSDMSNGVARVGRPGDPHQTLLDIVGLHPASVEYHSRYAESLSELYNIVNLWGFGPDFWQALMALALRTGAIELLGKLGYVGPEPPLMKHVFLTDAGQITKVIDDAPISETDPIRSYTADGRNYIHWLIDAAKTSFDAVNGEQGFSDNATPETLLYLYLRHALMLGYDDASYALHKSAGFMLPPDLAALKIEPTFIHVTEGATSSESRFAHLYKSEPRITADPSLLVSDYITQNLAGLSEAGGLSDQLAALAVLADAPTGQLERAFAEHIDVCSYRFDAWLLALVAFQLQAIRYGRNEDGQEPNTGVYLGAYAWLEDLRPSNTRLSSPELAPALKEAFTGRTPLLSDPTNGGYVHAPSIPHARTAAVLRSGFLANATPSNPKTMAVNLSSDRVRLALSLLEGIRNGQSLGALLGYRFERGLHDDHDLVEVDKFIYPLRKAFPLVADTLATTKTGTDVPIEAIEARNVLDGRKLIERVRASGIQTYRFGLTTLPLATNAEAAAINAEVDAMLDVYDAIADLALAEGVHQAVQGNFDRIAATLDAYTTGNFPPEPEVIRTPADGIALTHRVAVHFRPGLAPAPNATPSAQAEPALDAWLGAVLPPRYDIACTVAWADPVSGVQRQRLVTLTDLRVRPIDVLDLIKPHDAQSMTELDDRVLRFIHTTVKPRPDAAVRILYMTSGPGKLSVFEVAPLVQSLKTLVAKSRPLRATDVMLHNEATPEHDTAVFVDRTRVAGPKTELDTLSADIGAFLGSLGPLVADPVAHRDAIVSGIDGFLTDSVELLQRAQSFNLPLCGWGFAYAWLHAAFADLLAEVRNLIARWNQKLADFDGRLTSYDALPPGTGNDDRFRALRAAEILISTALTPLPPAPGTLRAALNPKRTAFVARRDQFAALLSSPDPSFAAALAAVNALLPVSAFDTQTLDLSPFADRAIVLAEDLVKNLTGHRAQIDSRRTSAQAQLDAHDAAASAVARAEALQAAAKALLGEDFYIVPEFKPSKEQADEWANAVDPSATAKLLDYLKTTAHIDLPVDEWLSGAACVRPMLNAWQRVVILAGVFGRPEPALVPLQLPYEAGAPWLAMQFPPDYELDSDRLLYTAHYPASFDKTASQCGLLVDEWTEAIPATTRTTGITFNFDRPDSEPPQSVLLVTPATANGTWQWDDIVGALNETLDLAKKRAVEPTQLDATVYSQFLPATIMAAALYGISITTTLAAANGAIRYVEASRHA
jgi:hypothetical protein